MIATITLIFYGQDRISVTWPLIALVLWVSYLLSPKS